MNWSWCCDQSCIHPSCQHKHCVRWGRATDHLDTFSSSSLQAGSTCGTGHFLPWPWAAAHQLQTHCTHSESHHITAGSAAGQMKQHPLSCRAGLQPGSAPSSWGNGPHTAAGQELHPLPSPAPSPCAWGAQPAQHGKHLTASHDPILTTSQSHQGLPNKPRGKPELLPAATAFAGLWLCTDFKQCGEKSTGRGNTCFNLIPFN